MIDVVSQAVDAAWSPSAWAALPAVAAGAATSVGPCVVPRLIAVTCVADGASGARRALRLAAFVAGSCASFVLFGALGAAAATVAAQSPTVYRLLALASFIGGAIALVRVPRSMACLPAHGAATRVPWGAAFVAGFGCSIVGSPCCGPVAGALAGAAWHAAFGPLLLAAFAVGHALPLVAIGAGWIRLRHALELRWPPVATATVSGALLFWLSAYYGLLA